MATVRRIKPEGVLGAVEAAVAAMVWLTPADAGMVALALKYAQMIDESDDMKAAAYAGQGLSGVLRALGGAPAERRALGVEERVAGKLAALRASR